MDDHVQPLLEPSWANQEGDSITTDDAGLGGAAGPSTPWDEAASRVGQNIAANSSNQEEKDDDDLPKIVLVMRLGNMGAASLLIFGSVGNLTNIFSLSKMVLGGYGICFGTLVCCLEVNFSFLRHPIASNFGFLYNPFLRLIFYVLMGMVAWSFDTLLGMVASIALGLLSLVNTYVLCRYPGYRAAQKEIADEDEKMLRREGRKQAWKHATSLPWWEV
ncbi:hypothetical protein ACHAXR_006855 [Thalassiosira sp. AJA248-18]